MTAAADLNHTPVKPRFDPFAKNFVGGYAPDHIARAHERLLATIKGPGVLKRDLRGCPDMTEELADEAQESVRIVLAAVAAWANEIRDEYKSHGADVGSEMDADPYQYDVYVRFTGEDR
jgi:hypothetical protein